MKGYVEYKAHTEDSVEKALGDAQVTLKKAMDARGLKASDCAAEDKPRQFEWLIWDDLSPQQLNAHRSFLTEWYWRRKTRTRAADESRNTALMFIGAISFSLLLLSAAEKDLDVPVAMGLAASIALWFPVFSIMLSTWTEDRVLSGLFRETRSKRFGPKLKRGDVKPTRPPSSEPFPGMIYVVTNHIRRKYADN